MFVAAFFLVFSVYSLNLLLYFCSCCKLAGSLAWSPPVSETPWLTRSTSEGDYCPCFVPSCVVLLFRVVVCVVCVVVVVLVVVLVVFFVVVAVVVVVVMFACDRFLNNCVLGHN